MLNSKECLEHICKNCDNKCCPYIHYEKSRCGFYGVIRQDLDRLEKLEKENLELKEKCKMLEENEEAVLTTLESSVQENTKLKKVIEDIKNLPDCDICDSNWHKGCMCLQNKFKKAVINNNFKHMFDNCKLTPLPELEELKNVKD